MTEQEMRELDAWIQTHVFNKPFEKPRPAYSTDPAAAMAVLRKCAQRAINVRISTPVEGDPGTWSASWAVGTGSAVDGLAAKAETLPLAICRFAKELFKKS